MAPLRSPRLTNKACPTLLACEGCSCCPPLTGITPSVPRSKPCEPSSINFASQWRCLSAFVDYVGVVVLLVQVKAYPVLAGQWRRCLWASLSSSEVSSGRSVHPKLRIKLFERNSRY